MLENEVILTEYCGSFGECNTYTINKNEKKINQFKQKRNFFFSLHFIINFFREIVLPHGYPESVSEDYYNYQLWDTVQAFCSTITGAFTTRAILKGVGVGDTEASALSAAITWILKEGTGMIGRIIFAWLKGNNLDADCKKWRFFADILNDGAMTIELFLPTISSFSMQILCLTSTMKSIVGIAGGATRASITQHQAIKNNMAEVSAKDGTQETIVNLIASFSSIYLLNVFNESGYEWFFIFFLIGMHLFANYLAVKSLVFKTFNHQRLYPVVQNYLQNKTIFSPAEVNKSESVFLGIGHTEEIFNYKITLGQSINNTVTKYHQTDFQKIILLQKPDKYLILVNRPEKEINISFQKGELAETVIKSYFNACFLAMTLTQFDLGGKKAKLINSSNLASSLMKKLNERFPSNSCSFVLEMNTEFYDVVNEEYAQFKRGLIQKEWNLLSHSLIIGEWRIDFNQHKKNL